MNDSSTLKRTLGPMALIIYGVGDILGAGVYALTGKVAGLAGEDAWLAFGVAMVVAALTAFSYAEFSARHPHAGGAAYFLTRATRRPEVPVFIGWLVLCSGMVSMAAGCRAFAGYLCTLLPFLPNEAVVVAFLAFTGFVAFWGIRESSTMNIVCTVMTLLGLAIVIGAGFAYVMGGHAPVGVPTSGEGAPSPRAWLGIAAGAALAFYAFIGFEDLANVAEEAKSPERNLPLAIIVAMGVSGLIYMLVAWVATRIIHPAMLSGSEAPLLDLVGVAAPAVPAVLFTVFALFAVADTALINCVMGSRLLFGLAREGLLPAPLGAVHPARRTPHIAILFVITLVLCLAVMGTIEGLAGTTAALLLTVFAFVHAALLVVKWRERDHTGFQTPTVVPVLGLLTCLGLIGFAQGTSLALACGILAVGLALAAWRGWANRKCKKMPRN